MSPYNWNVPAPEHPAHGIIDVKVHAAMYRAIYGVEPEVEELYGPVERSKDAALMATALQRIVALGDES